MVYKCNGKVVQWLMVHDILSAVVWLILEMVCK